MAAELLDAAVRAHGGWERWQRIVGLRARLSASGLFLALKCKPRFRSLELTMTTRDPAVRLCPFLGRGRHGLFRVDGVRIEEENGSAIVRRSHARRLFGGVRRLFWWDDLDLLYFAGYALWNYLSLPFLLLRPGFEARELEPWREGGEDWRRLYVRFPPGLPTHCPEQTFYFDSSALLRRHDYTAEVIGGWADAAHYSWGHKDFDGLVVATQRRVFYRTASGRPRRRPPLLSITVEHVAPIE